MGLTNAPQQFQQMIDDRLEPVRDIATPYIDDILVGTSVEEGEDLLAAHDRDLRRVMERLKEEQFVVDDKANFFVPEVEFCGQILGYGNRRPAPGKLMAIEKWEVPRTITALRAFLGFTNYYNSYIHMYAQVAARLQDKLKVPRELGKKGSKQRVEFDAEDLEAFEELKRRLCQGLSLQRVNPDKPFVLRVDASGYAVGATLEQLLEGDGTPTSQDVMEKKLHQSHLCFESWRRVKGNGSPGTRDIRHNFGIFEMGKLDWVTASFGTHRSSKFGGIDQGSAGHPQRSIG